MPRAACIIPALYSTESLETTLVSVLERRNDDCEVIVVLRAAYDDPYQLQGEVQFLQAPPGSSLVACLNVGLAAATAPVVHFLASGWQAGDGWMDAALARFDDPGIAAVAPAIFDAADRQRLLTSGVGYNRGGKRSICRAPDSGDSLWTADIIGPMLLAAFYRKSALDALAGVPSAVGDSLADIDIALSLVHAGWQTVSEPNCSVFALSNEVIETSASNGYAAGLNAERLFWRHAGELGRVSSMAAHMGTVAGDFFTRGPLSKLPAQLLGRAVAIANRRNYREYRKAIQACRAVATAAKHVSSDEQAPQVTNAAAVPHDAVHCAKSNSACRCAAFVRCTAGKVSSSASKTAQ